MKTTATRERKPRLISVQTDAFALGQMLTFDLGSHASSGMLSLARVTVPAAHSHVVLRA